MAEDFREREATLREKVKRLILREKL